MTTSVRASAPHAVIGWAIFTSALWLAAAPPSAAEEPAYHLEAGSIARNRVVVLGRDLRIDGDVESHAVAIDGSVHVSGGVAGDVIVLGGEAVLEGTARIGGDVFVLGGNVRAAPGATVAGRSVAYPDASADWLILIEGPALGLPATAPVVVGAKLALLAFWALLTLLFFAISPRELLHTSESIRLESFRNFILGLTGVLALVMTALFFSAFSGVLLGLPLLVLVAVVALGLRFWGMVAVFHALGYWLCGLLKMRRPSPIVAASVGLLALGVLKFLPYVGIWTWSVATFIGVGAALATKVGRREPWFQTAPPLAS